ncbi:RING-H2 finger protein ATL80 [Prunus persica]|uniref:RING-H2 finger protein ATL80 n=1 Tax=Prunus persica TaxID=3760 RepID=UPI0009AB36F3|nr:RING-H2 finger protein ATL80 [Prunus persica]
MALQFVFCIGKTPIVVIFVPLLSILGAFVIVMIIRPILWLASRLCRPMARARLSSPQPPGPLPDQDLHERNLRALPRVSYNEAGDARFTECAICLMEFVDGDVIRVLPYCGHGYHVSCVDRWLKCHSSCPSCRGTVAIMEERCPK